MSGHEAKSDGDIMDALVSCSHLLYAVIQASSKKDGSEQFVIAYQDENCLRGLIAAPSIIGLNFASREEAIANVEGHTSGAARMKEETRTTMAHLAYEKGKLPSGQGLVAHRRKTQGILHTALAMLTVLFYSKSFVSVMIRIALGASF